MLNLDKILKFKPTGVSLGQGKILISNPLMHDYFFGRSLILLTDYENIEIMGLILNKVSELFVTDIFDDFPIKEIPLFIGGPVQSDTLFILHKRPDIIQNSNPFLGDLSMGGDFFQIQELLTKKIISKEEVKFFMGYSGWGKQQLADEIDQESWLINQLHNPDDIFKSSSVHLWESSVQQLGAKYHNWLNFPKNPLEN